MFNYTAWVTATPYFLAALAFGYALGSIPFGYVFTRLSGRGDIRKIGSGNIGATNVLRTGNKLLALATLLADGAKGLVAVLLAAQWGPDTAALAGLGAFVGHLFPVWLRFRGGKGVATYLGVLAGIFWPAAFIFLGVWLGVAFITRYSSLSALTASVVTLAITLGLGQWQAAGLFAILTVLVFIRHRENIRRLIRGEESKIGAGA